MTKSDRASQVYERLKLEADENHQKQIDGAADALCPKISAPTHDGQPIQWAEPLKEH